MTLKLKSPGLSYPGARFRPKVKDGVKGWNIMAGTTIADARRNHAPGGVRAKLNGSPSIFGNRTLVDALDHFFETGIPDSPQHTFLACARSDAGFATSQQQPVLIGNYGQPDEFGGASLFFGGATIRASVYVNTPSGPQAVTVSLAATPGDAKMGLYGCRYDGNILSVYNFTAGTVASISPTYKVRALSPNPIRIGSGYAVLGATAEMALSVIATRAVSDDELFNGIVVDARLLMAELGYTGVNAV